MRINNINNIGFKAQYYQESPNTKKQIAKIFDDKIAEKTAEFQKQHEITKQEVDKLNKIKG